MVGRASSEAHTPARPLTPGRAARRQNLVERVRRSEVGEAVTTVAKRTLRRWGTATAALRVPPDFIIVGTKRGGTTSLHHYLSLHPGVQPLFPRIEKIKGVGFFDENWRRGGSWYLSHFPTRLSRALAARRLGYASVCGEATPYYLFHPLAAERARSFAPEARIIVLLRDPVERAFSHYKERRKNRTEPLGFAAAIETEGDRLEGEEARILRENGYVSFAHRHSSYVEQGRYLAGLRRWLEAYPPGQVLVLRSEDLFERPAEVYRVVLEHLGLPLHEGVNFEKLNAEPSPGMPPDVRARLEEALREDVRRLEEFLGRSMGWSVQ